MSKMKISRELIDELLEYNPITGSLTWKKYQGKAKRGKIAGSIDQRGYVRIGINKKKYMAHRLIWILLFNEIPQGMEIDHINHSFADNRLCNLRAVTPSENQHNRSHSKNNTSGKLGVRKVNNRYRVSITHKGKQIHLGCFNSFEEASYVRTKAEVKYEFHDNHGSK